MKIIVICFKYYNAIVHLFDREVKSIRFRFKIVGFDFKRRKTIAMILCIGEILTAAELETIVAKLETAKFVDGKATAGWHARLVKHNT